MYAIRYKELVKKDEGINNNMAKKRDKKNKLRGKWLRGIIIVYLFLILCNLFHEFPSRLGNLHSIPVSEEWYLIVVNRWNEIPEDYRVELTELSNGQKVDSRIYPYLQEMFDAARKDGIYPVVWEGYRTYEEQQKILDDKIKAYINEGYSQSRAERTAKEWVALPGTSEHQLGIAVDINADKSKSSNDEAYTWLAANAHNYGFCIDKEGVTEEWLNSKAKTARKYSTVFYRGTSDDELDLSGFPKSSRDNIQVALEKQVLIISLGAKLKVGKCKAIRDWFLANEFADFGDLFTNFFMSRRLPKGFVENKDVQQKVVEYFASFDEHIKDFRIEKVPHDGETKEDTYKINALHKMIDSDGMAEIPLGMESAGTLKMFALYPELQEVLEKGSVFFIDELNARLHPLLVRNFLLTFLNPNINVNHAQLVFTTHDTWQLSNQLLRRDEIWFVEKDDRGVSTLYSLADFVDEDGARIRKDESYEKNYLIGKYGAIPTLKSIDMFKED